MDPDADRAVRFITRQTKVFYIGTIVYIFT